MSMIEALIQELEQEAQTTRRVLERVPDDRLGWKPHAKSMSLGQLALHVATTPGMVSEIVAAVAVSGAAVHASRARRARRSCCPRWTRAWRRPRTTSARSATPGSAKYVARGRWRPRGDGDAGRRRAAVHHAEPLVSPPRPAVRVSPGIGRAGAVDLRAERRREPVRGALGSRRRGLSLFSCASRLTRYGRRRCHHKHTRRRWRRYVPPVP